MALRSGVTMRPPGRVWSIQDCGIFFHCGGAEDAIVGGVIGIAMGSVGGGKRGSVSQLGEDSAGGIDQVGVDVDARDIARAEAVAQQRGQVAGSGADLQDVVVVGDRELVKHAGGEAGLNAGAGGLSRLAVRAG